MAIRITPHRQLEIGKLYARLHADRSAALQNQITSGIRVHKPSDDPLAIKQILDAQAIGSHFDKQSQTIDGVRNVLNAAHTQVRSAQQQIVNIRDLGLQARELSDPAIARAFALEIDSTLRTLGVVANTRSNGQYLFSGAETSTAGYGDLTQATNYQGSSQSASIQIAGAGEIKTYYSGEYVFQSGLGGETLITRGAGAAGGTGAVGGIGTASGPGRGQLQVQHTATIYVAGSGIQPGSSSPGGDSVIGPAAAHQLQIQDTSGDGSSGTISLNGGDVVNYTSADTNLAITGPGGEIVYVDTTAITAGFSGTIDLEAQGTLSLDGGLTTVPIDFSQSQTVVDQDGNVRHIDSVNVRRTGVDQVEMTGNTDIFEALRNFRDDLLNFEDFPSTAEWSDSVGRHLEALEQSSDHLLDIVGEQSIDLQSLDRLQTRADDLKFEAEELLSELQGTDFTEAILQLQESQNLNQYTLAALANVFQVSILDYI